MNDEQTWIVTYHSGDVDEITAHACARVDGAMDFRDANGGLVGTVAAHTYRSAVLLDALGVEDDAVDAEPGQLPESVCSRCQGPNLPWSAPSPLWNQVMRGGDINGQPDDLESKHGIICPTCFMVLAEEAGVADLWQLSARRVHVPLQTVTPSGRVWNEQTWKFDEPAEHQTNESKIEES